MLKAAARCPAPLAAREGLSAARGAVSSAPVQMYIRMRARLHLRQLTSVPKPPLCSSRVRCKRKNNPCTIHLAPCDIDWLSWHLQCGLQALLFALLSSRRSASLCTSLRITATPQATPTPCTCTLCCRSVQRSPSFGSSPPPLAETRSLAWRSQGLNGLSPSLVSPGRCSTSAVSARECTLRQGSWISSTSTSVPSLRLNAHQTPFTTPLSGYQP